MSKDPSGRLVLASSSPRRRVLLSQLNLPFDVDGADICEDVKFGETPEHYVERLAREKSAVVALRHPGRPVLAADTSVILGNEILGKPQDDADAVRTLQKLSGHTHRVLTAVALHHESLVVTTHVTFRPLASNEIAWYVQTREPQDKAGAYAIQGIGAFLVARIEGSPTNVIGLPLVETLELLRRHNVVFAWDPATPL